MSTKVSLLLVTMGGRRCAVDCAQVVEIIPRVLVDPLPNPPPGVLGVVNVRGRVVSVVDVRHRVSAQGAAPGESRYAHIVIMRLSGRVLGLVADEVEDVHVVSDDEVERPGEVAGGRGGTGVVRIGDDLVLVLEPAELLGEMDALRA